MLLFQVLRWSASITVACCPWRNHVELRAFAYTLCSNASTDGGQIVFYSVLHSSGQCGEQPNTINMAEVNV
jgi:hypothetical protein